jgi:hypothetical protein
LLRRIWCVYGHDVGKERMVDVLQARDTVMQVVVLAVA